MSRRLFSHDPVFGVTKFWHYDETTDTASIETVQDIEPLLQRNADLRNAQTGLDKWGDGRVVASIPMTEYAKLLTSGAIHDQNYLRKWLNQSETQKFRTYKGRV